MQRAWKELAVTDVIYKVIAFVVLIPLASFLFPLFLALSGRSVLVDQDILIFFSGPVGWICLVVVGAVRISVVALEQTALMTIACAATQGQSVGVRHALQFTGKHAWRVVLVTGRMIAVSLLAAAPFLAAVGLTYFALLTKHDINYYLHERPAVFWVAAAVIGSIVSGLVAVLVRLAVGWAFALPVLLFENIATSDALRISRERVHGHRWTIARWILGWFLAMTALSAAGTGIAGFLGHVFLPTVAESLWVLVLSMGAVLVFWGIMSFIVTLVSAVTFALVLVNLYVRLGCRGRVYVPELDRAESVGGIVFRFSGRTVLAVSVAAIVLAAAAGALVVSRAGSEDHTEITAHRGASGVAPENTLVAVELAIRDGADWIEVDVQESADGQVVVVHDRDLKRLAGVALDICEATTDDLEKIDVGSWFAREFSDQRVPTLSQVLALCKDEVRVNIDLKYYGHGQNLEQRVIELVEAHGMASDVVIMSLEYEGIRKVKSLRPQWRVGLLAAATVGDVTKADVDFLAVNIRLATRRFIRLAHSRGKDVYVWTVNDPATMSCMIGRGADSIITDEPGLARSVLRQRARMSSVERLLVEVAALLGARAESNLSIDDV
jgi:glycerophosphoryl diester phosphodiesterase